MGQSIQEWTNCLPQILILSLNALPFSYKCLNKDLSDEVQTFLLHGMIGKCELEVPSVRNKIRHFMNQNMYFLFSFFMQIYTTQAFKSLNERKIYKFLRYLMCLLNQYWTIELMESIFFCKFSFASTKLFVITTILKMV